MGYLWYVKRMVRRLLIQIVIGIIAVWLASEFIENVYLAPGIENLLIVGAVLGLVNFFIKPALNLITLPLRLLTLGLFSILINMLLIGLVDLVMLDKFDVVGIIALFWMTLLVWGLSIVVPMVMPRRRPKPIERYIPRT